MKDFVAIDFETANGQRSSICSVGLVIVRNGEVPFVAHNAPFDEGCLKAVFAAYDKYYPAFEFQCTCRKSRQIWKEGHHNLDIIAGYCGYDLTNHHHALADAEACAVIGIKIL